MKSWLVSKVGTPHLLCIRRAIGTESHRTASCPSRATNHGHQEGVHCATGGCVALDARAPRVGGGQLVADRAKQGACVCFTPPLFASSLCFSCVVGEQGAHVYNLLSSLPCARAWLQILHSKIDEFALVLCGSDGTFQTRIPFLSNTCTPPYPQSRTLIRTRLPPPLFKRPRTTCTRRRRRWRRRRRTAPTTSST